VIGKLFIISAPSGAGKTSLARALIDNAGNAKMSVSHTTRERRKNEREAEDYFFVSEAEFLDMVEQGVFLAVEEMLRQGTHVLLDIDWQGARLVREQMPDAVSISILPPSVEELERRLRGRGSDSDTVINRRMSQAFDEMERCDEADFIVLNDDFNEALSDLTLILRGESDKLRPLAVDLTTLLAGKPD